MASPLTETDRYMLGRARALLGITGTEAIKEHTGYDEAGQAYPAIYGEMRYYLAGLAAILGRLDGEAAEDYYCASCGGRAGIFLGHGNGWHHFRGEGTPTSPVEIYDPGHAAAVT